MNNGNVNNNNKDNNHYVRAVSEFQEDNNAVNSLSGWFDAYYSCRRNKGRSYNACRFEVHHEKSLIALWREVEERRYRPGRSIAFIVTRPVQREIFAAEFRDRIVHHWIAKRIEPILERCFISESFNCRKDKGNSAGIACLRDSIRTISDNYTRDCYVMRLDLRGFFMSIDRQMLSDKLCAFVKREYVGSDASTLLYLIRTTLTNAPENNCVIKGTREDWKGLDSSKSLFTNKDRFGLPIGNLTSQISANYLLDETDHYIREDLGLMMIRYVDDYCIIDADKNRLIDAVPLIRKHLKQTAGVMLHPRKFYLQHYTKGVKFIGAVVKPDRVYVSNRTISSAYMKIHGFNKQAKTSGWAAKHADEFITSMNSYLGIMKHYATYGIRRKLINRINAVWWRFVNVDKDHSKLTLKPHYKEQEVAKMRILRCKRKSIFKTK